MANCYDILGIKPTEDPKEIQKAYRALARIYHPDNAPAEEKAETEAYFKRFSEAYITLSDPEKKRDHDHYYFIKFGNDAASETSPQKSYRILQRAMSIKQAAFKKSDLLNHFRIAVCEPEFEESLLNKIFEKPFKLNIVRLELQGLFAAETLSAGGLKQMIALDPDCADSFFHPVFLVTMQEGLPLKDIQPVLAKAAATLGYSPSRALNELLKTGRQAKADGFEIDPYITADFYRFMRYPEGTKQSQKAADFKKIADTIPAERAYSVLLAAGGHGLLHKGNEDLLRIYQDDMTVAGVKDIFKLYKSATASLYASVAAAVKKEPDLLAEVNAHYASLGRLQAAIIHLPIGRPSKKPRTDIAPT